MSPSTACSAPPPPPPLIMPFSLPYWVSMAQPPLPLFSSCLWCMVGVGWEDLTTVHELEVQKGGCGYVLSLLEYEMNSHHHPSRVVPRQWTGKLSFPIIISYSSHCCSSSPAQPHLRPHLAVAGVLMRKAAVFLCTWAPSCVGGFVTRLKWDEPGMNRGIGGCVWPEVDEHG